MRCKIKRKLNTKGECDYYCALLFPEYRPGWMNVNDMWDNIFNNMAAFFEGIEEQKEEIYQTGMRVLPYHIKLARFRMELLRSLLPKEIAKYKGWEKVILQPEDKK